MDSEIETFTKDIVCTLRSLDKIGDVVGDFLAKENGEKISVIENILKVEIDGIVNKFPPKIPKDDDKSEEFRAEGNALFSARNRDLFKAIECYNKSVCFSKEDSDKKCFGYANRSAALYELGMFKECIWSIDLAEKSGYPQHMRPKLQKRESNCLTRMMEQEIDRPPHKFKMLYDGHILNPNVADCLDLRTYGGHGHGLFTLRDLSPVDLIGTDKPFCKFLLPNKRYLYCANCLKENYFSMIPCNDCTCTMYCNTKCMAEGYESFHKYECPVIDAFLKLFGKMNVGLQIVYSYCSMFDNVEAMKEFFNNKNNKGKNIFIVDNKNLTRKEELRAVQGLKSNEIFREGPNRLEFGIAAAVQKQFLLKYTQLKDIFQTEDDRIFLSELLYHYAQVCMINAYNLSGMHLSGETEDYGTGIYPFCSLINHSCAPNAFQIYQDNKCLLFTIRPIKANTQIFISYGPHFYYEDMLTRVRKLKPIYGFKCDCEACWLNYPLARDLKFHVGLPRVLFEQQGYNWKLAECYKRNRQLFKDFHAGFPCEQLYVAEKTLKIDLNILAGNITFKSKMSSAQ